MLAVRKRQLKIPAIKEVKRVRVKRRFPQPQVGRYRVIKKFEILHRPFDIRFRGRINKWLQYSERRGLKLKDVLKADQLKLVNLYFYPQEKNKKWLNQIEVLKELGLTSKKKLKKLLISILHDLWVQVK